MHESCGQGNIFLILWKYLKYQIRQYSIIYDKHNGKRLKC